VIHAFTATTTNSTTGQVENADGAVPIAGLTKGNDSFLYGVTSQGGTKGYGTIFAISPDGATFTTLHNFDNAGGARPAAELALFSDTKLYGTTVAGGKDSAGATTSFGTLFSIARDGTGYTVLHSLDGTKGAAPASVLIQLSDTVIAGSATTGSDCSSGSIFRYDSTGGTITGNTKCGRKKSDNSYGGGVTGPAVLLLLGGLGLARRRRR
jgi:MYXO-CTERM domain-containing protein